MKIFLIIIVILALCGISFWCGFKWKETHLGTAKKYVLEESINLWNSDSESAGKLPKGTFLYDAGDSKSHKYYVFLNISGGVNLIPHTTEEFNLIAPLEGSE